MRIFRPTRQLANKSDSMEKEKKNLGNSLCQQLFRHVAIIKIPKEGRKRQLNEKESHPPFNLVRQFGRDWQKSQRHMVTCT